MSDAIIQTDHSLSTILDNLSTAVILLNDDLNIQFINPACENLFQISFKRAYHKNLDDIFYINDQFNLRLKHSLETEHPFAEHEITIDSLFSGKLTVNYTVTPLLHTGSKSYLLIEFTHLDRHLRITREEKLINEQNATKNLIRGMAHEIKNPLGGLRGAAQLLERELPDKNLKEYTQIIIGEADRLQNLVDRMLGPKIVPQKQDINIHQVLEHVRQLVLAECSEGIHFNLDYDPSLPYFSADPDLLIQAVLNITRNAIAALDNNGEITFKTRPVRHFTIGHKHHRLVLQIDIMDNGHGIDDELIEQIFYPMVTGRADGTGLGLSIAQSLINQHDGLIECISQPGNTIFTIYLPLELNDA
ncbi:MAG: nitrogen regulation protein NR(II) [Gammaproteobacteria bacterium]|nr:nitrogen regulation protein NR(II) [Gammaproteobacteria bacterium]